MAVIGFNWCSCRRAPQGVTCSFAKGLHPGWGGSDLAFTQYLHGPVLEGQKALGNLELVAMTLGRSLDLVPPPQMLFHPPRNLPATVSKRRLHGECFCTFTMCNPSSLSEGLNVQEGEAILVPAAVNSEQIFCGKPSVSWGVVLCQLISSTSSLALQTTDPWPCRVTAGEY